MTFRCDNLSSTGLTTIEIVLPACALWIYAATFQYEHVFVRVFESDCHVEILSHSFVGEENGTI